MKPQNGFTLIELMITMSISAILVASAVPSMMDSMIRGSIKEANTIIEMVKVETTKKVLDETGCSTGTISGLGNRYIKDIVRTVDSVECSVILTFDTTNSTPKKIQGKSITWVLDTSDPENLNWTCSSTLPEGYRTNRCL